MKATTKALFGGALFAAGIAGTTETANAQWTLDELTSFTQVFAGAGGTPGSPGVYNYGTGGTYSIFGGTMSGYGYASISDSSVYAMINTGGTGYGVARAVANVTVSAPKKIYANWDFTDYSGLSFASIQVYDVTNGVMLWQYGAGTSGAGFSINLAAGDYQLAVIADSDAPAKIWGGFSKVPSPGALAVLGLGALGVRRRRRS